MKVKLKSDIDKRKFRRLMAGLIDLAREQGKFDVARKSLMISLYAKRIRKIAA